MLYSDRFENQWEKLINDFLSEMQAYPFETITFKKVNEWYRVHIFRWSSIAESEGILLESEKNEVLKIDLIKAIDNFSFIEVKVKKKPSYLPVVLLGILTSVGIGALLLIFMHARIWMIILEIIAIIIFLIIQYAGALDKYAKSQRNNLCSGYAGQMKTYKDILQGICKKYE